MTTQIRKRRVIMMKMKEEGRNDVPKSVDELKVAGKSRDEDHW
jgi:hypothetical protein